MVQQLTKTQVEWWLENEEDEFYLDKLRTKHQIDPESDNFYKAISRLCDEKKLRRLGRGLYRKIKPVKPIQWRDADESKYYDFKWFKSHSDYSTFGFEDTINISANDLVVIAGVSNYGKSTLALNLLGENVDTNPCILMGNEYTTLANMPSPKFKRRMMRMNWVDWGTPDGKDKFLLLPIRKNYEDYIEGGNLTIIDWINLTDNFYRIGKIFEDIKTATGNGVAVAVIQKEEGADLGRGRGFTRDMADVYFSIDPYGKGESRLTVGKVKDPKRPIEGRIWAFKIVDSGANLTEIREIERCKKCKTKGFTPAGPCQSCNGKGYVDVMLI